MIRKNTSSKPTILQVCPALKEGGVERGTAEMSSFLIKNKWGSVVISAGGPMELTQNMVGTISLHLNTVSKNPLTIIKNGFNIAQHIRKQGIDLVHVRSRAPAWSCYLACWLTNKNLLTTWHGTHSIGNPTKKFYNSIMGRGIHIIAISQFIKNHIIENYNIDEKKITVVPRGFDEDTFDPDKISQQDQNELLSTWQLTKDIPIITLPGRLTRWKGQIDLIEALAELKNMPWQAIIIGGAGKKQHYKKELETLIAKHKLEKHIKLVGSYTNMPLAYSISDIIVSASTEPEAFGRVAVEAQAMRKPIVATGHGGSLETIVDGKTGLLYEPKNAKSMAKMLRKLLEDQQLRHTMGDNGYTWVHNNFTVSRMCAGEMDVYKRILELS